MEGGVEAPLVGVGVVALLASLETSVFERSVLKLDFERRRRALKFRMEGAMALNEVHGVSTANEEQLQREASDMCGVGNKEKREAADWGVGSRESGSRLMMMMTTTAKPEAVPPSVNNEHRGKKKVLGASNGESRPV